MRNFFIVAIILALGIFLAGCASEQRLDKPPNIRYGEDPCDECRMIINEARYAAAYVTPNAHVLLFDDIGCMIMHIKKFSEPVARYWVVNYTTEKWEDAQKALFVKNNNIATPMGFGIVAFSDSTQAKEVFPPDGNEYLSYTELLSLNLTLPERDIRE